MFVQSLQANRVVNYSTGLSKVFQFGVENIQRRDKKQTEVTAVTLSCAPPQCESKRLPIPHKAELHLYQHHQRLTLENTRGACGHATLNTPDAV